jgi:hypothetical protein
MNLLFPTILLGLFPLLPGAQEEKESLESKVNKLLAVVKVLQEKVSHLEIERKSLKEDVEGYRKQVIESARRIFELRQTLKNEKRELPEVGKEKVPTPPKSEQPEKTEIGPEKPIRAKVQFVDRTEGFFLLDKGQAEGIKPGYRFEIVRNIYTAGKEDPETKHIGIGEVDKLLGTKEDHAKLILLEGDILTLRYDDIAIAYRKDKEVPLGKKEEEWNAPQFKIVGMTNDVYMASYGGMHGAKTSQIVFLYRDRKLVVKLRIDSVEKDYCIARVIKGTKKGPFGPGDIIEIKERKTLVVGRLIHLDEKTGIWIDVGSNDGAKQGMKIAVMRRGKKVGELVLEKVERFWSTAILSEETRISDLKMKDYVEEIPAKKKNTQN